MYQNIGNNNNILQQQKSYHRHPMTHFWLDEKYGKIRFTLFDFLFFYDVGDYHYMDNPPNKFGPVAV